MTELRPEHIIFLSHLTTYKNPQIISTSVNMKIFAILSLLSVTALAGTTWYDPNKEVTCTGDKETGAISCEAGHIGDAPVVRFPNRASSPNAN